MHITKKMRIAATKKQSLKIEFLFSSEEKVAANCLFEIIFRGVETKYSHFNLNETISTPKNIFRESLNGEILLPDFVAHVSGKSLTGMFF